MSTEIMIDIHQPLSDIHKDLITSEYKDVLCKITLKHEDMSQV